MGVSADIRNRLIDIEKTIVFDGATVNAARSTPLAIHDAQLPLFVNNRSGAVSVSRQAAGLTQLTSTWVAKLIVVRASDKIAAQNEADVDDLIDLTIQKFITAPALQLSGLGLDNVVDCQVLGFSDAIETYPSGSDDGHAYYVVNFNLRIVYYIERCEAT